MKKLALASLVLVALLAACGGSKPQVPVEPGSTPVRLPERATYTIGVGDKLEIRFPYYPGYTTFVVVRPDGAMSMAHVGEIVVEGMTPLELQEIIRSRYAEIVTEPEVTVMVAESSSNNVFVFGEVRTPGVYALSGSMTVLDAIVTAGGATAAGSDDSVILMRQGRDGRVVGSRVNLEEVIEGDADNPYLAARDVIYVPTSFIGKVDVFVSQFFTQLTPTWFFYIYGREALDPEGKYILGR
ncbi:MAG: polysaccharide biosynthesis/export family protein [bacterium]